MVDFSETDNSVFFYKIYEHRQNKLLLRIILWSSICIPLLLLGRLAGIFPFIDIPYFLTVCGLFFICYFISTIIFHKKPYSAGLKYFLLIFDEFLVVMLSLSNGFDMYISYALVPLVSCIYLNRKFSMRILLICYLGMIIGIIIRANTHVYFNNEFNGKRWGIGYGIGLSIEYIVLGIIINAISKRNRYIVDSNYEAIKHQTEVQKAIITSYVAILCQKNSFMEAHINNCSEYTKIICNTLRNQKKFSKLLTNEKCYAIYTSALLHDLGIISVPDKILNKKETLTDEETEILKTHTVKGAELISNNMNTLDPVYLEELIKVVKYHHEEWSGTGYPEHLKGEEIPFSARIIYGANALDSMLSNAPFFSELDFKATFMIIEQMGGNQMDPEIAKAIIASENQIKEYYKTVVLKQPQ